MKNETIPRKGGEKYKFLLNCLGGLVTESFRTVLILIPKNPQHYQKKFLWLDQLKLLITVSPSSHSGASANTLTHSMEQRKRSGLFLACELGGKKGNMGMAARTNPNSIAVAVLQQQGVKKKENC